MNLKVLLVEDLPSDAELAIRALTRAHLVPEARRVDTESEFLQALEEFRPDVILSDFSMPGFSGLAALDLARQKSPDTPFIFVSGTIGEDMAVESLKRGATDYVLKGNLARLPSAIQRAQQEATDRAGRQSAEQSLRLSNRAIEASITPILIADCAEGRHPIRYVNAAFERVTGYSRDEVVGRDCSFLQGGDRDQPEIEKIRAALREEREGHALLRNYRKDGGLFWNDLHITPVRDPQTDKVTHFVGVQHDVTDARRYQEELEHQANHDALTGLANRNLLNDRVGQAIVQARRYGGLLVVALLDLDHFKLINDSLGHGAGDRVLKIVAERLTACTRQGDTVARFGGDEFVLVLPNQENENDAVQLIERIVAVVGEPMMIDSHELSVTCSIGLSAYPYHGDDVGTLLRNADTAMYRVKAQNRNGVEFYAVAMTDRVNDRLSVRTALRNALERDEFVLHYQPQFDLRTGLLFGAEALIKWNRPGHGLVSPGMFIPWAEESGLIVPIGAWALKEALLQNKRWQDAGLPPITMAVNLSAQQFRQEGIVDTIADSLRASGLDPSYLELELTETMMMHSVEKVIVVLQELKSLGIQITVDDFGIGFSSLNYLKRFPVDRLKIDKSFVQDIGTNSDDTAIVQAVIALGHSLHLRVLAEGVETDAQLKFLREAGCDEVQGYYFSKPTPAAEFGLILAHGDLSKSSPGIGTGRA